MRRKLSSLVAIAVAAAVVVVPVGAQGAVVVQNIDLSLDKAASTSSVLPGEQFGYTLTVTNTGLSAATDVRVTDTLPAGIEFVSGNGCSASGSTVTCAVGTVGGVGSGANTVTITLNVVAGHTSAGACVNTATVTSFLNGELVIDADPSNDSATATVQCDLVGSIGDFIWHDLNGDGAQDAGEPGIAGVTVTLTGGPGGTSVSGSDGLYPLFSDLPAGEYTVTVGPAPAGMVATTPGSVTLTLGAGETFLDADFGFRTPPPTTIDLELAKSVNLSVVPLGTAVTWTITVTNKGPAGATGVVVGDALPAGVGYVSHSGPGSFNAATATWNVGSLGNGASASLSLVTTIDTEGLKINRAQIASADQTDIDSTPGNCPALPAAAAEDDCADAEVGTVLQATTTTAAPTTTTTTVADTLVKTGPTRQTRDLGILGLVMVLLGGALVLAAAKRGN
jgi:uncharacterized repeat protein (TIGR01451 family)